MRAPFFKKDRHILGRPLGIVFVCLYKVLWGCGEIGIGLLLLFSSVLIRGELVEDPQDIFVHWLFTHTAFDISASVHAGLMIFLMGLSKWGLAWGVWMASWRVRKALLVFLLAITSIALLDMTQHPNVLHAVTLLADLGIFYYLWKIFPRHLRERAH